MCPVFLLVVAPYSGFIPTTAASPLAATAQDAPFGNNSVFNGGYVVKDNTAAPAIRLNPHAAKFIKQYLTENGEPLLKAKQRSRYCFAMMDSVLNSYRLPVELKYLAVVESELNPKAVSEVGAAGPWQLMPETARLLGLRIKGRYDERTHFNKSTVAAARYLRDLYAEFGDWLLVIAAYNSGPGPVYQAIRKSGSRNFWRLQYFLPAETRGHVKRFIGTHYFFEGKGSITTLTKTEMNEYLKACVLFKLTRNDIKKEEDRQNPPAETSMIMSTLSGLFLQENS
jgi:membrane-bound lytic murein transglycosylase D